MVIGAVVISVGFLVFVEPFAPVRPEVLAVLSAPLWVLAGASAGLFVAFDLRNSGRSAV